jgi:hypothetical protein
MVRSSTTRWTATLDIPKALCALHTAVAAVLNNSVRSSLVASRFRPPGRLANVVGTEVGTDGAEGFRWRHSSVKGVCSERSRGDRSSSGMITGGTDAMGMDLQRTDTQQADAPEADEEQLDEQRQGHQRTDEKRENIKRAGRAADGRTPLAGAGIWAAAGGALISTRRQISATTQG